MNNLLYFLIKARPWILFTIYFVLGCVMLFNSGPYQQSVYLTSANAFSTGVYKTATGITSYFNLKNINEDLQRRNSDLEMEVLSLKQQLVAYHDMDFALKHPVDSSLQRYNFILAHVINNSVHRPHNYITIQKGALDGVKPEMGVVDQNGVVGKVNVVGPHSARIISLLNDKLPLSCKVKKSNTVGSLVWNGKDYREALLEEIPRHATFAKGDTVITSGYSTSFPEGIPVGVVIGEMKGYDDNYKTLRVKLFTDFSKLSTVRIIVDNMARELKELESQTESDIDNETQLTN
ncbi:MAG: rod shape-determining protein MreC [Firmicutes bacterium]|nr:rod shape-determining protein MreC [Bacillota bacterium]MCM1401166.1 rod shape-determining protein MreC [Bacteroides sp.]MCM1477714.1 rod shape-determining protein MreC [Bacteroides sp.]